MLKFFLSFCKYLYNKISKFSYKINDKLAQFLCKETIFFAEFSKTEVFYSFALMTNDVLLLFYPHFCYISKLKWCCTENGEKKYLQRLVMDN